MRKVKRTFVAQKTQRIKKVKGFFQPFAFGWKLDILLMMTSWLCYDHMLLLTTVNVSLPSISSLTVSKAFLHNKLAVTTETVVVHLVHCVYILQAKSAGFPCFSNCKLGAKMSATVCPQRFLHPLAFLVSECLTFWLVLRLCCVDLSRGRCLCLQATSGRKLLSLLPLRLMSLSV